MRSIDWSEISAQRGIERVDLGVKGLILKTLKNDDYNYIAVGDSNSRN